MSALFVDEASDISSHAADALAYSMYAGKLPPQSPWPGNSPATFVEPVSPIEIACKACGVEPGERCIKTHRRYGRVGRGFHFRRKDDARLATETMRALRID